MWTRGSAPPTSTQQWPARWPGASRADDSLCDLARLEESSTPCPRTVSSQPCRSSTPTGSPSPASTAGHPRRGSGDPRVWEREPARRQSRTAADVVVIEVGEDDQVDLLSRCARSPASAAGASESMPSKAQRWLSTPEPVSTRIVWPALRRRSPFIGSTSTRGSPARPSRQGARPARTRGGRAASRRSARGRCHSPRARFPRKAAYVRTPAANTSRRMNSFGACMFSSGKVKPRRTDSSPTIRRRSSTIGTE